jgi:tRNA threonylcarbamoyladenosine biosynthesis protein TsaB
VTDVPDWMLVLDASTPRCVVVLGRIDDGAEGPLLADEQDDDGRQASAQLHLRIAALFERAGIVARDLVCIGCGRGPGTFTGTRVALATAMGLAEALGLPVVAVSTLAAVAGSIEGPTSVLAVLDARRGEVYAGLFERTRESVLACGPERCAPLQQIVAESLEAHLVGPGVLPYADRIDAAIPRTPLPGPTARGLWRAALSAHLAEGPRDAATLEATYLRESYAELGVNVAKRPTFKSPLL